MSDGRKIISLEDAILKLPEGEIVHTFRNPAGGLMIGANWDREDIVKALHGHEIEETGPQAQTMNHGLAIRDNHGWLFIETKKAEERPNKCAIKRWFASFLS